MIDGRTESKDIKTVQIIMHKIRQSKPKKREIAGINIHKTKQKKTQ